jgi:hypothetical protein
LRGIPEVVVKKYPVGYDTTVHYVANIEVFGKTSVTEMLRLGPLFYWIMWSVNRLLGIETLMLLKIVGPVLYGLLGLSFACFLAHCLAWDWRRSTLGAAVFLLQIATLRLSWDMFRLELGLILLFMTLVVFLSAPSGRKSCLIAALSILMVLADPMAAVLLFFSLLWIELRRNGFGKKAFLDLLALGPGALLFLMSVLILLTIPPVPPDARIVGLGRMWFFLSYFQVEPRLLEGSYLALASSICVLLLFCYGLLSPFIARGLERNAVLDPFLLLLSVASLLSFSPLIVPWLALPVSYWRWILLLIIPFAAYSLRGMVRCNRLWRRRALGLMLVVMFFFGLAFAYASGPSLRNTYFRIRGEQPRYTNPDTSSFDPITSVATYIPSTLVASSITVGNVTGGIDDTIAALNWLSQNAPESSCLLAEERFWGWTRLYTPSNLTLGFYVALYPMDMALQELLVNHNFGHIYLIWYHGVAIHDFEEIYSHGTIGVYEYRKNTT